MVLQPKVGKGLLIIEASRSHSDTPHSVELLWTSDQSHAETFYLITHNNRRRQTSMPPAGLEPALPGSEGPQTLYIEGAVTIRNHLNHITHSVTNQNWSPTVQLSNQLPESVRTIDWLNDWLTDWPSAWSMFTCRPTLQQTRKIIHLHLWQSTLLRKHVYWPT